MKKFIHWAICILIFLPIGLIVASMLVHNIRWAKYERLAKRWIDESGMDVIEMKRQFGNLHSHAGTVSSITHKGIDIFKPEGTPIIAPQSGFIYFRGDHNKGDTIGYVGTTALSLENDQRNSRLEKNVLP